MFRMTTLVECWNKLDGNVGELSSWVTTKVSHPTIIDSNILLPCISHDQTDHHMSDITRTLPLPRASLRSPSRSWSRS